jgi:OHCU decarboxylase
MPQASNPDASSVRKITAEAFPASIKAASFPFWAIFSSIRPGWGRAHGCSALSLTRMLCIANGEGCPDALRRAQHDLICAHPDLAGKAAIADEITDASKREQAGSGLGFGRDRKNRGFSVARAIPG